MDTLVDGRYLPLEERGRGAVARVWRALDLLGEEEVALKVPLLRAGARGRRELLGESVALARLEHEGVVRLHSVECSASGPIPPGTPYLVLEHLWAEAAERGALSGSPRALTRVASRGLEALRHLHGARLLHGDLKPDNVLIGRSREGIRLTLIDLGSSTPARRRSGAYAGSSAWAAPELLLGGRAGPRSDLYSLGRILHHLAGGAPPFDPDDPFGLSRWLLRPRPLRPAPALPPALAIVIDRLTRPSPSERPPSAEAALRKLDVEAASRPCPTPRRPPRGVLRTLRAGLGRAREGEAVTIRRRVREGSTRRSLLCRAAAEGARSGFLPLRPGRAGGRPARPRDLLRLLRMRRLVDHESAEDLSSALAASTVAAGRRLLLLLDGTEADADTWRRTALPPGSLLLFLSRDGPAYNSGP